MLKEVMHIGITVSDMDRSIAFYRDVLGLKFIGEILMEGDETDRLFAKSDSKARVAYLSGSDNISSPPIELIQFVNRKTEKSDSDLFRTSVSEICFCVDDIEKVYEKLMENNVQCLSFPCSFDFTLQGFGKSKAIYFRDPDGIILELMQNI